MCCDNCGKKADMYFEFIGDKLCSRCLDWATQEEEQIQQDAQQEEKENN